METCNFPCLNEIEDDIGKSKMQIQQEAPSENGIFSTPQNATSFEAPDICEETSYHELRCPSNEELYNSMAYSFQVTSEEYEQLLNMTLQPSLYPNYYKIDECYPQNRVDCALENTDDQLSIEIVKEEVDSRPDANEETSIFDSISFNIDDLDEDSFTLIKMTEPIDRTPIYDDDFEKPPDIVPEIKKKVKIKPKNPLPLANYRSLITQAINSSPEKRMILTEIYQWIMEQFPYFKDNDKERKNGWKNCVRHTLSVNEIFIRIKNTTNCRYSYWTVCEEGDFNTKFAAFPWVTEVFKPEERKRVRRGMNRVKTPKNSKKESKKVFKKPLKKVDLVSQSKQNLKKKLLKTVSRKLNTSKKTDNKKDKKKDKILNGKVTKRKYQRRKPVADESNMTNGKMEFRKSKQTVKSDQNTIPVVMHVKKKKTKRKKKTESKTVSKLVQKKKNLKNKAESVQTNRTKTARARLKQNAEVKRKPGRPKSTGKKWKI